MVSTRPGRSGDSGLASSFGEAADRADARRTRLGEQDGIGAQQTSQRSQAEAPMAPPHNPAPALKVTPIKVISPTKRLGLAQVSRIPLPEDSKDAGGAGNSDAKACRLQELSRIPLPGEPSGESAEGAAAGLAEPQQKTTQKLPGASRIPGASGNFREPKGASWSVPPVPKDGSNMGTGTSTTGTSPHAVGQGVMHGVAGGSRASGTTNQVAAGKGTSHRGSAGGAAFGWLLALLMLATAGSWLVLCPNSANKHFPIVPRDSPIVSAAAPACQVVETRLASSQSLLLSWQHTASLTMTPWLRASKELWHASLDSSKAGVTRLWEQRGGCLNVSGEMWHASLDASKAGVKRLREQCGEWLRACEEMRHASLDASRAGVTRLWEQRGVWLGASREMWHASLDFSKAGVARLWEQCGGPCARAVPLARKAFGGDMWHASLDASKVGVTWLWAQCGGPCAQAVQLARGVYGSILSTIAEVTTLDETADSAANRAVGSTLTGEVASAETLQMSFRTMLDAAKLRSLLPPFFRWGRLVEDLYEGRVNPGTRERKATTAIFACQSASTCGAAAAALRSFMSIAPQCYRIIKGQEYKNGADPGELMTYDLVQQLEVCHKTVFVFTKVPRLPSDALAALQKLISPPGDMSVGGHKVPGFKALVVLMLEVADLTSVGEMHDYEEDIKDRMLAAIMSNGGEKRGLLAKAVVEHIDFVAPLEEAGHQ